MALYHPGVVLLALSTLLGILGFLQASNTPLIPLDQLTIEQAYLEVHLIDKQLLSANPPNITAEQRAIVDRLVSFTGYGFLKPNDLLPNTLRQMMTNFRQAFTNWKQPLKPGTAEYLLARGLSSIYLYSDMLDAVRLVLDKGGKYEGDKETLPRASNALDKLRQVYVVLKNKFDKSGSLKAEDVKRMKLAINEVRDAVIALPRVDPLPAGNLPGGSRKSRNKLSHHLKRPYIWGPALVLAVGAAGFYYLLKGHPASSSGDLYSLSTTTLNVTIEGLRYLWYFLLVGLVVALIALAYWWYYFKARKTPPEAEAKVSKRTSKTKSRQLPPTTTGAPGSAGIAST